jgi:hypothetical protein
MSLSPPPLIFIIEYADGECTSCLNLSNLLMVIENIGVIMQYIPEWHRVCFK